MTREPTPQTTRRRLAVIGGGAAGHKIAYELRDVMDVTLIDPKTYWEVPMALPRLLVEPTALAARMDFASFLPSVRHVQGKAISLTDQAVTVETVQGQTEVVFDYAVVATGSRYLDPLIKAEALTDEDRAAEIKAAHERIRQARAVVVAGGGPVGVETAAEIRESFGSVPVTVVHGGKRLMENGPGKFGYWAKAALEKSGAAVILDDRVEEPSVGRQPQDGTVRLRSGRILDADVIVWAAGIRPTTGFVATAWPDAVQADGFLRTDDHLRLAGHPTIFVAGDVTNLPEGRLVVTVTFHVPYIVRSLTALVTTPSPQQIKLKPYKPAIPGKGLGKMMVVTLGRRDGLTSLPFGQFRMPFLARKIKAEKMLVPTYRRQVGLS